MLTGQKKQENKKQPEGQLDFYNYKLAEIAHEIDKINLNETTPIDALNTLIKIKENATKSLEDYKEKFGFPVIDFYDRVGFDMEKESFHELSVDFVETYDKYAGEVGLNIIRIYSIPFCFLGIAISAIYQYVIGIRKLDTQEKGLVTMISFITILVICQILPLAFAIVVKFGRG